MNKLLIALLFAASPLFAVVVDFSDLNNVKIDGANAGCLADIKVNHAKSWKAISSAVILKVRERCSDKTLSYVAVKAQVDGAKAVGLVIPDADVADLNRRK